jgi:uncharacterized protein YlxP (DUF503 family)
VFIGASRIDLRIPVCGSLKGKRHVIKGITGGLRSKFNAAVAEVGYQDVWQRATIGVAVISDTAFHVEKMLREIERFISRDDRIEIIHAATDVQPWED